MSTVLCVSCKAMKIHSTYGVTATRLSPLDRLSVRAFAQSGPLQLERESTNTGNTLIKGMRVFRTGTFKDSWGEQHTWEAPHLAQMVFNFELLRSGGLLEHVPVRDGHPSLFGGGGEVVGWVTSLYVQDNFLLADFEVTEPAAVGKLDRGTYRARSSEIGFYETNDEAMYWPVFMGFAFVDIPAVEGLFSHNAGQDFTIVTERDIDVANENKNVVPPAPGQAGETQPGPGDPEAPEGGGAATPAASTSTTGGVVTDESGNPTATEPGNQPAEQPGGTEQPTQHGYFFTVGGQRVNDFVAVQRHIDTMEQTLREQERSAREEFVKGLAGSGRIPATQIDSLTAHALSLSPEQYETFSVSYGDASPAPLFAHHGNGSGGGTAPAATREPDELEIASEIVRNHKMSGMQVDAIKRTPSYKKLEAAGKTPTL